MGLLKPPLALPFNITRMGYVVLTSSDFEKTRFSRSPGIPSDNPVSIRSLKSVEINANTKYCAGDQFFFVPGNRILK